MEIIRYTPEQLLHLRDSPLVQKPDGLPAIEQWMETPSDQNQKRMRNQIENRRLGDEQPASHENQRPSLFQTRHLSRSSSTAPEDIVLGPPKTSFASASANRVHKLSDNTDRPSSSLQEDESTERPKFRDRWSRERESDRRDKNAFLNGRRPGREESESWSNLRTRKGLAQDDGEFPQRANNREGFRFTKDTAEGDTDSPLRRNGMGRGKYDQPWLRDESNKEGGDGYRLSSRTSGGWRDRGNDRRDEGSWRNNRVEEEPEWLDTAVKDDKKKVHTQEDFQRWKERMKASASAAEEKEAPAQEPAPSTKEPPAPSKPATPAPLALEGGLEKLFGMWGEGKGGSVDPATAKTPASKPKSSKFASFFSPQEEASKEPVQAPPGSDSGSTNEDKEGFQRILQMLGSTNISTTSSQTSQLPPARQMTSSANGARPQVTPLDTQTTPFEQQIEQPYAARQPPLRSREERTAFVDAAIAPRAVPPSEYRPDGPQMRNGSIQDSMGLQRLLGVQPQNHQVPQPQAQSQHSQREFLLTLMQQSSQAGQQPPNQFPARPLPDAGNFPLFREQDPKPQILNKPKGPPPGFFDTYPDDIRREIQMGPQDARRNGPQRPPPGFFDDPAIASASLQRRNTADVPQRHHQLTNMGIPQNTGDAPLWMKPPGIPGPNPQDRIAPPPGFSVGPPPRQQPPGFGGPNMPFSAGSTPLGHPGLPRNAMQGGGPPGGIYPGQMPPGPPGYFGGPGGAGPPNFPPMPGMPMGQEGLMGPPGGRRPGFDNMFGDLGQMGQGQQGGARAVGRGQFGM